MAKSSNRSMVELWSLSNRRIMDWCSYVVVELSNGGVVESWSCGMVELCCPSCRIVESSNVGVVDSSNCRMVEWWSFRLVESVNGGVSAMKLPLNATELNL